MDSDLGFQKTIQWYIANENRLENLPKNILSSTPWKDLSWSYRFKNRNLIYS